MAVPGVYDRSSVFTCLCVVHSRWVCMRSAAQYACWGGSMCVSYNCMGSLNSRDCWVTSVVVFGPDMSFRVQY